ncbi:MAG TPA: hypothetical protein VN620_07390, partial [Candidatus Methylomirabilis sp.]|nr:hypothetical protein [Candidatus Methylomirabilis sp.]
MLRPDELIRPLKFVESSFLQVLVTNFSITRAETGFELELSFRDDDLAISTTAGKTRVIAKIKGFTARADDL